MSTIQKLFTHSLHTLPQSHVDFVTSDMYKEKLESLVSTEVGIAKMTLKLLEEIALDPLVVTRDEVYHFTSFINPKQTTFWIRFHCLSNPLPSVFGLETDTDLCRDLIKAIKVNMNSKMYKAAQIDRRLMNWRSFRGLAQKRFESRARKAAAAVMSEFTGEVGTLAYLKVKERSEAVYSNVLEPLESHFRSRHQAISKLAIKNIDKGFSFMVADFMLRNIMAI